MRLLSITILAVLTASLLADGQQPSPSKAISSPPSEVRRVALVIGAENYDYADTVPNALNDASDFKQELAAAGFLDIRFLKNPTDDSTILDYVQELADSVSEPDEPVIFLFYFAGHGFQNGAWPSIVPTGAKDYYRDSVTLDKIMAALSGHKVGLAIFLLDSCRTGLSSDKSPPSITQNSFSGEKLHLSAFDSRRTVVLDLATELGEPAHSVIPIAFNHSPFTFGLLSNITHGEESLANVFDDVRTAVAVNSRQTQSSVTVSDANISRFYLRPSPVQIEHEDATWQRVAESNREDCVLGFALNHPGSHNLKAAVELINSGSLRGARDGDELCPRD